MNKISIEQILGGLFALIILAVGFYFTNEKFANRIKSFIQSKPYVSYNNQELHIEEFDFAIGIVGINQISGDLDKLNKKVFNLLNDKAGKCEVIFHIKSTDQYGNPTSELRSFGHIDIDELKKYQDSQYFTRAGGIQRLLDNQVKSDNLELNTSTTLVEPTPTPQKPTSTPEEFQRPEPLLIYRFYQMTGMPWLHYSITENGLEELTASDERLPNSITFWETFCKDIDDIEAIIDKNQARLNVINRGKASSFTLKKLKQNYYIIEGEPSIALEIVSPSECVVYFMVKDNCIGVSNKSIINN